MSTIAVVIPCFRVKKQIEAVLGGIGPEVSRIYVVDDACAESTGKYGEETVEDERDRVW